MVVVVVLAVGCQPAAEVCGGAKEGRPLPDATCTTQVMGAVACPEPGAGWGYTCTSAGCWQLEASGVCATDAGVPDAGVPDGGACTVDRCANEGSTECRAGTSFRCTNGCLTAEGQCSDGGLFCSVAGPWQPEGPCTAALVGVSICPAGLTGSGYECLSAGCWALFSDGPCAVPRADAGACASPCQLDAGDECAAGVRSRCIQSSFSTPCWVDVGVCP